MSARNLPSPDRGDMLRLVPQLIGYARGLGCSEEHAPAMVRDVALAALQKSRPGASAEEIEEGLRQEIGIRCLEVDHAQEGGTADTYLEGIRLAQKLLQLDFEALDRIDPDLRRVFVLRVLNRLSHAEVAKAVGATVRQVKARLARAMREIATMRGGQPGPGAMPRIAPASGRLAAASASGSRRPPPAPSSRLRIVHGGKR